MPVIQTHASVSIPESAREKLKAAYGKAICNVPGKSERWLMCLFDENKPMYLGGDDSEPCAFVEVSAFARNEVPASAWEAMTEEITPVLTAELDVDPSRIYIQYGTSANFGWNGSNF